MRINFIDIKKQYQKMKSEIDKSILDVVNSGNFIMGQSVLDLETTLNKYTGSKHAISCSSGTDALLLALKSLNLKFKYVGNNGFPK